MGQVSLLFLYEVFFYYWILLLHIICIIKTSPLEVNNYEVCCIKIEEMCYLKINTGLCIHKGLGFHSTLTQDKLRLTWFLSFGPCVLTVSSQNTGSVGHLFCAIPGSPQLLCDPPDSHQGYRKICFAPTLAT